MVPLLPGCFRQGETVEEVISNARDAIQVHVHGLALDGDEIPQEAEGLVLTKVDVRPRVVAGKKGRQ